MKQLKIQIQKSPSWKLDGGYIYIHVYEVTRGISGLEFRGKLDEQQFYHSTFRENLSKIMFLGFLSLESRLKSKILEIRGAYHYNSENIDDVIDSLNNAEEQALKFEQEATKNEGTTSN